MKLHKPASIFLFLISILALCLLLVTVCVIQRTQSEPSESSGQSSEAVSPPDAGCDSIPPPSGESSVESPEEDLSIPSPPESDTAENPPDPQDSADPFPDTAIVGNSFVFDLKNYGLIPSADIFARVGLTVRTVFTKSAPGSSIPVIDELNARRYRHVVLVFGENELGWVYPEIFKEEYAKVIDAVRQRQPDAAIYIQALFPVSAAASEKNEYNTNNSRIQEYNQLLETLASETGANYLDPGAEMRTADGCLPDGAASDGIHPNIQYCEIWVEYLRTHLKGDPS